MPSPHTKSSTISGSQNVWSIYIRINRKYCSASKKSQHTAIQHSSRATAAQLQKRIYIYILQSSRCPFTRDISIKKPPASRTHKWYLHANVYIYAFYVSAFVLKQKTFLLLLLFFDCFVLFCCVNILSRSVLGDRICC